MKKVVTRFYTIADYNEEETFLNEMQKKGWKFVKLIIPCFFIFEECVPEDVVYRLDFKNNKQSSDYMQMINDYGWEYAGGKVGWLYFRKSRGDDDNLFSDNASKIEMINHIFKTRMLPFIIFFIAVVIPNCIMNMVSGHIGMFIIWLLLFGLYFCLITYCGLKIRKLKKELER